MQHKVEALPALALTAGGSGKKYDLHGCWLQGVGVRGAWWWAWGVVVGVLGREAWWWAWGVVVVGHQAWAWLKNSGFRHVWAWYRGVGVV